MNIFTKKTVFEIDSFDLGDFIAEKYKLESFECELESPNDSTHSFTVKNNPNDPMMKWDLEDLEKYIKRGNCEIHGLHVILDDMCRKGWIESGNYLVKVCW